MALMKAVSMIPCLRYKKYVLLQYVACDFELTYLTVR